MKKILQAAGLVSASAAILSTPAVAQGAAKWYTLKAGIRGFYDDNIYTAPKGSGRVFSSPGVDFSPGFQLNFPSDQTKLTLGYDYTLRWFADRDQGFVRNRDIDQTHVFNLNLGHNFSPRYKIDFYEQFASAQEPDQFVPFGGNQATLARAEGSNIRNFAGLSFDAQLSRLWSAGVSYQNQFYDYDSNSFAAPLNRMEHIPGVRLNYQLSPKTVVGGGYTFNLRDYDDLQVVTRDNQGHQLFGSVDHSFTGTLVGSARVGVEFTTYDAPGTSDATNPYADANLTWTYSPGSQAVVGISHRRSATDAILQQGVDILDSENTSIYGSISHAITARLRGALTVRYQTGDLKYSRGTASSITGDDYLILGATVNYRFTSYLSGEVAYYFDQARGDGAGVFSNGRNFDRNRVFFGVRLTY